MVDPLEDARVSAELVAKGTDASPLEAVFEPVPEEKRHAPELEAVSGGAEADERSDPMEGGPEAVGAGTESREPGAGAGRAEAEVTEAAPTPVETLYEVLGVSPQASRDQIDKAYRFCLDMYKEGALATYSLLDPGDAEAARRRISLAHETLADSERRWQYDLSLGLTPSTPTLVPFSVQRSSEGAAPSLRSVEVPAGPLGGADLRRIRESRGIALREVAASTKIGLRSLEYLEEDRFEMLPPPVYLRGFLQEYARVMGMDPRRTAEAYMARMAGRE
jgi:Helix-turn-helix domain/DnaJ domain